MILDEKFYSGRAAFVNGVLAIYSNTPVQRGTTVTIDGRQYTVSTSYKSAYNPGIMNVVLV